MDVELSRPTTILTIGFTSSCNPPSSLCKDGDKFLDAPMLHGFLPPERFFPYLTWTDVQAMPDKENVVIVQPVGAIEQHGPHLPLVVDSAIGLAVLGKALHKLDRAIPAYAMPSLYYGKSNEHWHFPGTITLSAQTLMATLTEIGESLYRSGFRKLVLLNSHGGQPQILEIMARDLHQVYAGFFGVSLLHLESAQHCQSTADGEGSSVGNSRGGC